MATGSALSGRSRLQRWRAPSQFDAEPYWSRADGRVQTQSPRRIKCPICRSFF